MSAALLAVTTLISSHGHGSAGAHGKREVLEEMNGKSLLHAAADSRKAGPPGKEVCAYACACVRACFVCVRIQGGVHAHASHIWLGVIAHVYVLEREQVSASFFICEYVCVYVLFVCVGWWTSMRMRFTLSFTLSFL